MFALTLILFGWLFLLPFLCSKPLDHGKISPREISYPTSTRKVMIGYYLNLYVNYQPPSELNWGKYTDMVYFGAKPMADLQFTFGSDEDNEFASNGMQQFVSIATQNGVRPLLGVGGEQGSSLFSSTLSTPTLRKNFVYNLVTLAQSYGFAGVVISWQFPNDIGVGCNAQSPQDVRNLGLFAQEFKSQWSQSRLIVRAGLRGFAGSAGTPAQYSETSQLSLYADYIDLMAYDAFTGKKEKHSGPFSLMTSQCGRTTYSNNGIMEALAILQSQGFPPEKLILGLAGYGRVFFIPDGVKSTKGIVQRASGSATKGGFTDIFYGKPDACNKKRGYEGIYLLQELMTNNWLSPDTSSAMLGLDRGYDDCAQQPYLYNKNYLFVYDDVKSFTAKAQYAKSLNLVGMSIFDVVGMIDIVYQGLVKSGYGISQQSGKIRRQ